MEILHPVGLFAYMSFCLFEVLTIQSFDQLGTVYLKITFTYFWPPTLFHNIVIKYYGGILYANLF